MESDTLCLPWRMAAWQRAGKFTVGAADSLPKSTPEGNKEERRGASPPPTPPLPSPQASTNPPPPPPPHPTPPILMHKQIRVTEKIEGLRMYVGHIDEKSFGYLNFASSRCVRGCAAESTQSCAQRRVSLFMLGASTRNKSC